MGQFNAMFQQCGFNKIFFFLDELSNILYRKTFFYI